MRWVQTTPSFLFSTVPVFVIGCSTMARSASCLMGSPMRGGTAKWMLAFTKLACMICGISILLQLIIGEIVAERRAKT